MKWRMESPCANCPFSNSEAGIALRQSLKPGRIAEIKHMLRHDGHFNCHKTTGLGLADANRNLQCAGALAWQAKYGYRPNQMERICKRIAALNAPMAEREEIHTSAQSYIQNVLHENDEAPETWTPIEPHDVTR